MTAVQYANEALEALSSTKGGDVTQVTFTEVNNYLRKKYGNGSQVGDSTFYGERSRLRKEQVRRDSVQVAPNLPTQLVSVPTPVENEVTLKELQEVQKFVKGFPGGMERITVVLSALKTLS